MAQFSSQEDVARYPGPAFIAGVIFAIDIYFFTVSRIVKPSALSVPSHFKDIEIPEKTRGP